MPNKIEIQCEKFIESRNIVEDGLFKLCGGYTLQPCACIIASGDKMVTSEQLKECKKLIKSKAGVFSNFRGIVNEPMACMLALADDPEKLLDDAMRTYKALREYFFSSEYLALSAIIIARLYSDAPEQAAKIGTIEEIAQKTRNIYETMKKNHPFLTSSEDGPMAAMMLFSGKSEAELCAEAEECYTILKSNKIPSNSIQSVSHILALGEGNAQEKCAKLMDAYDAIALKGFKYGKYYELPVLASLTILPVEASKIADDIVEAAWWLKGQRGYGFFGPGKKERLMHAAMIAGNAYIAELDDADSNISAAAINCSIASAIAIAAAQQAALMSAVAASSAAASASN